ncbi:chymotrypsin-2-like [Vanessa cardui]|uniref:chymotrypsin-2-like n=1 Tax=Vanessa cardui TaxID=171605 RepID=UPI001F1466D9|nr:chymotrypsin-2-like [Vanessa cardui]
MYVIFLLLFCFLFHAEGKLRIVGGSKAPPEFGKFSVSLQNITGHHVCGGAIISHRHLATAAHCVYRADAKYIKVVVGTTDLDLKGLKYNVESIHIHDSYNYTLKLNDIAIITIKGLFDLRKVEMIRLDENNLKEGEIVQLTGFGAQKPHGESSRKMHALNLTVFDQNICQYAMRYTRKVYDSMFCTFTKIGQGACHGDSGGPLTKDNKLVGIVSWGIPCAVGFPDVHTRISQHVKWIRKIIDKKVCTYCNFVKTNLSHK